MFVSSDCRRGIGQENLAFWSNAAAHYDRHKLDGGADHPAATSLAPKWRDIKWDVAKFRGAFQVVKDFGRVG